MITTYRRLAESVLDKLAPWTHSTRGSWTAGEALPGGEFKRAARAREVARLQLTYPQLAPHFLTGLFARHGLRAWDILQDAETAADLGRDYGGGLTQCETDYLVRYEWARSADDILWRRTKCGLHMSVQQRVAFAEAFVAGRPGAST
jgi:glycerol-3-phosphate dehydrogenase